MKDPKKNGAESKRTMLICVEVPEYVARMLDRGDGGPNWSLAWWAEEALGAAVESDVDMADDGAEWEGHTMAEARDETRAAWAEWATAEELEAVEKAFGIKREEEVEG